MKNRLGAIAVVALFAALALGALLAGARPELGRPDPASARWVRYENPAVGYSLEVPDEYEVREDAGGRAVVFRYRGDPVLLVTWTRADEGLRQGIWFGEKAVGPTRLGAREGTLYRYTHHDLFVELPTEAHVVLHRGRFLGVELRAHGEPGPLDRRVLASLRFDGDE